MRRSPSNFTRLTRPPAATSLDSTTGIQYCLTSAPPRSDGLVEAPLDLVLEPLGGAGVDRIGDDHAGRGHREDRVVVVVPEPVDLAGDLGDLPDRLRRLLRERSERGEQHERGGDAQGAPDHDASVMALTAVGFSRDERSPGSLPR